MPEMNFAELNPKMTQGAIPGTAQLVFDCPKCGQPYQIAIYVKPGSPEGQSIWGFTHPQDNYAWSAITVTPSINNATHGRKPCGWHGSVINGQIIGD